MMYARIPHLFKGFSATLLLLALLVPDSLFARERHDTLLVQPSVVLSRPDNLIKSRQFKTLDEIIREQRRQDSEWDMRHRSTPTRNLTSYTPGSIPIQESVSPSGGRIYNIPVATASGWGLAPNIALVYNSQGGNNVAGYGWGISGLSSTRALIVS